MLHDTFNLIQFFPFSDFNFFHKNLLKVYLYIKKDQNGLIFFDFIKNCPEYSEIRAKTISVTPNTNYLQAITGKKVGDIVVINFITDWKQWAPGRINVGHINAIPIIFIAKKAILMDGSSGSIYAECNINIYENGNIEVVVPNEWQTGKLAHLVGIVTFLDQTI